MDDGHYHLFGFDGDEYLHHVEWIATYTTGGRRIP